MGPGSDCEAHCGDDGQGLTRQLASRSGFGASAPRELFGKPNFVTAMITPSAKILASSGGEQGFLAGIFI